MSTGTKIKNVTTLTRNALLYHLGDRSERIGKMSIVHKSDGMSEIVANINDRDQDLLIDSEEDIDEVLVWMSNELDTKQEWHFTFGAGQKYERHYVTVLSYTAMQARKAMIEKFGIKWCAQYDSLDEITPWGYKELKRLEVEDE